MLTVRGVATKAPSGGGPVSEPYPDVVARFYDAVYAQVRDGVDNAFYLERMASAGGPVLEIGVGTGRLLAEARRRGVDAWGIDVSPAMIERCRAKLAPGDRERVSVADAVRLRTDRRFALVCAPFRVLSHVYGPDDQLRLLDAVHDALAARRCLRLRPLRPQPEAPPGGDAGARRLRRRARPRAVGCAGPSPRSPPTSPARRTGSTCASGGKRRTASTAPSGSSRCASSSASRSSTSWRGRSSFSRRSTATSRGARSRPGRGSTSSPAGRRPR